jgi:phenylalanyl-tRNA synthetase beta chain
MFISKTWLKKYIADIDGIDDGTLSTKITSSLAEVEAVIKIGEGLEKLVAGKILEVEKHPKADKLNVCKVDVGFDKLTIVCGANNVRPDMMVIVCLDGGSVYSGKTGEISNITKTDLRGVESNGMICSEKELGISEEHTGIMELNEHYRVGQEIDDMLKDTIFEIENKSLTHRGDCFSHLGLAREIAAIFDLNFNKSNPLTEPV